jgi:quinolinate synthase
MTDYISSRKPKQVVLITECSMAANIQGDVPEVSFIGPCNMCPHMKRITLENIRDCLLNMQFEVTVPEDIGERARLAVQRMVDLPPPVVPARYDMIKARHHVAVELI